MKLMCLSEYNNASHGLRFDAGVIEVTEEIGAFLLTDAPGTFSAVQNTPRVEDFQIDDKRVEEPPRTTAMKRPPRTKTLSDD